MNQQDGKAVVLYVDKSRMYAGAEEGLNSLMRFLDRDRFRPCLCADYFMDHHRVYDWENVEIYYRSKTKRWWLKEFWRTGPPLGLGHLERFVLGLKLFSILQQTKAIIIHMNLYRKTAYLDLLAARVAKVITIAHVRSLMTQTEFGRSSMNLCDAIICTSDAVKKDVQRIRPRGLVRRIYNGVDINKYKFQGTNREARAMLGLPQDMCLISSIGILDGRKGHDTAIQSLPMILRANSYVMLVIAGGELEQDGMSETKRLQNIAAKSYVSTNVRFLGDCRNVPALYAASDIILALSKDGEAFGRVPVEAAIARRPVIATAVGATPEIIIDGETGFLVKPDDICSVAAKVLALLRNPIRYGMLLDYAERRAIQLFDSRKCNGEIQDLYLELLLRKNHG